MAAEWAKLAVRREASAQWAELGRKAGPIANQQMIEEGRSTLVVAFPGGRGTANMVQRDRGAGVELIEVSGYGVSHPQQGRNDCLTGRSLGSKLSLS